MERAFGGGGLILQLITTLAGRPIQGAFLAIELRQFRAKRDQRFLAGQHVSHDLTNQRQHALDRGQIEKNVAAFGRLPGPGSFVFVGAVHSSVPLVCECRRLRPFGSITIIRRKSSPRLCNQTPNRQLLAERSCKSASSGGVCRVHRVSSAGKVATKSPVANGLRYLVMRKK